MKKIEAVNPSEDLSPAESDGVSPIFTSPRWRLLAYVGLIILSLFTTGAMVNYMQCQSLCSTDTSMLLRADLLSPDAVKAIAQGETAMLWIDINETGVFTPTTTAGGTVVSTEDGQVIRYLDELAENGYIAIRVPHAPPSYTLSSLLPGVSSQNPEAVVFSYYSPISATNRTEVVVPITRRADLEAIVNGHYPIADGHSHWEVWWLPQGEKFPIPDQPFRLEGGTWPVPLALSFRIDFGSGANAYDCAGCTIEVLVNNGYVFVGPYPFPLRYMDTNLREPLASFGSHCGNFVDSLAPTIMQYISPTVPFSHLYCLENWDSVARTFTIDASSSQGWDYAYYSQGTEDGDVPQPVGEPPFTVEVPPHTWSPGVLSLQAVYTPTIVITDTLRETLFITATSVISPEVQASSLSMALAPGYTLNEVTQPQMRNIYLPVVVRANP